MNFYSWYRNYKLRVFGEAPRGMLRYMMKFYKKTKIVGIEIGVYRGLNAVCMLKNLSGLNMLYLIDPYMEYPQYDIEDEWFDVNNEYELKKCKETAIRRMRKYDGRYKFIFEKSWDAIEYFDGKKVDFVYIDGNHIYECVKRDIELYYPLVKDGGVMGGDNFTNPYPGVCRAVLEFIDDTGFKLFTDRYRKRDWWVVKE